MVRCHAVTGTRFKREGREGREIAAFTNVVRSFLLYKPEKPLKLMVGWCVNDYQIDVALPEGRAEYKRIIDRAAELGAEHLLFAPSNSALSRREESKDDWSWEHTLWLGLGQKIRKGEWDPRTSPIPESVQEMLDYARSKPVKLVAYVYPVVPFSQNPEWLVSPPNNPTRKYASLGVRSLQDWLIEELVAFQQKTGIGGYAFDHTFLGYEGTSRSAQWAGWRRGRAVGSEADDRRSHSGVEEGIFGRARRAAYVRRVLRGPHHACSRPRAPVRAGPAAAQALAIAGRVLRECGAGVHYDSRAVNHAGGGEDGRVRSPLKGA